MELFGKSTMLLEKGLDAYSVRSRVLANNISNVNTPNYKREDIRFEDIMSEALTGKNAGIESVATNPAHIPINQIPTLNNVSAEIIKDETSVMRNDGNNVDIEKEMSEMAVNNIRFQFAANRISGNFNNLKMAIKGR